LGSGGVGRTFKVEQVDPESGENFGTFVAKVMKNPDSGRAALQAYQRVRSHTTFPGLSVVFETARKWQQDRIVALLKWVEGDSLDGLAGVLSIAAEEAGDDSVEQMLIRCCTDVCRSLAALHSQGLVHGDVSPRNLICDRGGLTLTDYDLVTAVGKQSWGIGATAYCSPEAQRREPVAPSDDFYALVASLFEVAFHHPAFPSPHGALDKGHGLNWRAGERESLPRLADFFDRATHPDRNRRFSDAKSAIQALNAINDLSGTPVDTSTAPEIVQRSPQHVDWLDSLLRIYPGSPHGNIETRGLDSEFALATYVETPLEQTLFDSVRRRETRLVLLCGNAGDGKTALLQHLAAKFGIARHQSAIRIWEAATADGLVLRANLDGSASWQGKSANELLDEFLQPFLSGVPETDIAHLLAINDGRLYEWLENRESVSGVTPFTKALRSFLSNEDENEIPPSHVQFISLNHRSLVGGRTPSGQWSDDFLDRLIDGLLGGQHANQIWSPCLKCEAFDRCTAGPTAHRLLAARDTPLGQFGKRLRSRLSDALQAVHQRGQIHITTRELRGVLGYVLFGVKTCSELHADPGARPAALWDMLFAPESPYRQGDLLRELAALDPALESHPQLDRWLMGRTAREIPGAGHGYPGLTRDSARRRAYIEWSEQEIEALSGNAQALPLANGDHLRLFKEAALRSPTENSDLCARLCHGISQLESLPASALARSAIVPLRITPRTPTETYFWVEKPLNRFRLEAEWPRIHNVPLPVLPRRLNLIYRAVNGNDDVLSMGYELFQTLLSLATGEQLSELRSDDLFANLAIFTQRLAKEDEGQLLAWNPKSDSKLYRLGIERTSERQILTCEPLDPAQ
jgi:serine/threonine protein kinase